MSPNEMLGLFPELIYFAVEHHAIFPFEIWMKLQFSNNCESLF